MHTTRHDTIIVKLAILLHENSSLPVAERNNTNNTRECSSSCRRRTYSSTTGIHNAFNFERNCGRNASTLRIACMRFGVEENMARGRAKSESSDGGLVI